MNLLFLLITFLAFPIYGMEFRAIDKKKRIEKLREMKKYDVPSLKYLCAEVCAKREKIPSGLVPEELIELIDRYKVIISNPAQRLISGRVATFSGKNNSFIFFIDENSASLLQVSSEKNAYSLLEDAQAKKELFDHALIHLAHDENIAFQYKKFRGTFAQNDPLIVEALQKIGLDYRRLTVDALLALKYINETCKQGNSQKNVPQLGDVYQKNLESNKLHIKLLENIIVDDDQRKKVIDFFNEPFEEKPFNSFLEQTT